MCLQSWSQKPPIEESREVSVEQDKEEEGALVVEQDKAEEEVEVLVDLEGPLEELEELVEVGLMEIVLGMDLVDVTVMVEEEEGEDEMVEADQQALITTQHGMDQVVEEVVGEMAEVEELEELEVLAVSEEQDQQDLMVTVLGMGLEAVMEMEGEEVEAMGAVEEEVVEVVKDEGAVLEELGVLEE